MKHKVRSSYKAGWWSCGGNSQCELGRSSRGTEKRLPGKEREEEGILFSLEKGRRTQCPPSHKGVRGEVFPEPEQSGASHRAMSHPGVSVQQAVCEPGAGMAGVQAGGGPRGLEPHHQGPCLQILPPLPRQTKRGCRPARC